MPYTASSEPTPVALASAEAKAHQRRWIALFVLCAALFLESMNLSSINVQVPAIRESLQLSTATIQFVVSAYLVTYAGFLLLGGRIADIFGRRTIFISGVALFGLASFAGGIAGDPVLLIVARAFQGIGAALTTPAAMAIITTMFAEGPERNKAMGIYTMMASSGFAFGAVVSGTLTSALSWHWGFFAYAILAALVVLLTPILVVKDRPTDTIRNLDLAGGISITAGLLILVYAVGEAHVAAIGQTLGLLVLSIALLVAFGIIEARVRIPMLPFGIFRSRSLISANLVALTILAAFAGILFISTLYLQNVLNYTPFQAGLAFVPMGIVGALVSTLVFSRLINHLGIKLTFVLGMFLMAVGVALTAALISTDGTFWTIVLPSLVVGIGMSIAFPSMTIAAVTGVRDSDQGLASGLVVTGQQLGGALGLALITVVAAVYTPVVAKTSTVEVINQVLISGFRPALLLAAAMALLGALIALIGIPGRARK